MDDSRVTLTGTVEVLSGEAEKAARALYKQRHPDSFWIDFGDFEPFKMTSISKVRLNGGFARAATVGAFEQTIDPFWTDWCCQNATGSAQRQSAPAWTFLSHP